MRGMQNPANPPITLSIAAVERDTGLSKDTLRVWERRYGFPTPERDPTGERAYPLDQVERLRLVKRLLDAGHRPGRVVGRPLNELQQIAETTVDHPTRSAQPVLGGDEVRRLLSLLLGHRVPELRRELALLLARQGVRSFVTDVIGPLNQAVGEAWMRGQLAVYHEHLYSELVSAMLHQALLQVPPPAPGGAPSVLLSTLPGEPHGLGLLMAQIALTAEGCVCISLGTQTPLLEVVGAARALQVDIVGIGFTGVLGLRQVQDALAQLRRELPPAMQLWAGGSTPGLQRRSVDGVEIVASLGQIPELLQARRPQGLRATGDGTPT